MNFGSSQLVCYEGMRHDTSLTGQSVSVNDSRWRMGESRQCVQIDR